MAGWTGCRRIQSVAIYELPGCNNYYLQFAAMLRRRRKALFILLLLAVSPTPFFSERTLTKETRPTLITTVYHTSMHTSHSTSETSLSIIGASVSEPHLGSSTRPLSVCLSVCLYIYIYISYVRHFWSRGPRATRKRKPAHLKFKGHMHACCIILYVANASRAITILIERLHMYSSSLITSSTG